MSEPGYKFERYGRTFLALRRERYWEVYTQAPPTEAEQQTEPAMFARMELFWLSAPAFFAICQAWFEAKERKEMEELHDKMQRDSEKSC